MRSRESESARVVTAAGRSADKTVATGARTLDITGGGAHRLRVLMILLGALLLVIGLAALFLVLRRVSR